MKTIEYLAIESLNTASRNPRTHSANQIEQIARSIEAFGFTNPILIDEQQTIVAGHGRIQAAKRLGMAEVPAVRIEGLTPAQLRAYAIADNRLAEKAGWDNELLRLELNYLVELEVNLDLTLTGFESAEIDLILEADVAVVESEDSDPSEVASGPDVTQEGDLWQLGKHRILCGNATVPANYRSLMETEVAQVVFTDPPYNVPIEGHVCGTGSVHHREFGMAAGEMTTDQFTTFLTKVFRLLIHHSVDGSIHFICMDWRHVLEMMMAGQATYAELKNLCVWNKTNGGLGSLYRSKHELVFVFKKGAEAHVNNVQLGRFGRNRTNVWTYAGINAIQPDRQEMLALHPTVKPIPMVADALLDCSHRGDIVLDVFGGSGTTLLAAEQTGRHARLIELDPGYVDVTVRRFQQLTGDAGTLVETGETFDEISARRLPTGESNANEEA